jgi:hypothetical protein
MKKLLPLLVLFVLIQIAPVFSQTLNDFISAKRGDTLVVKTQDEMSGAANSLYQVIRLDSINVPAGRVYLLKAGGVYPVQNNPSGYANRTTVIMGSDPTPLVNNKSAVNAPPLICGNVGATGTNMAGLGSSGNLTVKNCALCPTANDGSENWLYTGTSVANQRIEFDNCLFEHTRWVMVGAFNANCSFFLRNCYFVNLSGQPCRRNGGVYDGFATLDTFLVENTTHIMSQGSMYKWRNYTANRIIVNHNTFVNNSGVQFLDLGTQVNVSYTNNMFVNSNVQPYPGIKTIDDGEQDLDFLPMGLVTVYPDSALEAKKTPRKFLVEGNNLWWDTGLLNIADTCNTLKVDGKTGWLSQMILMNSRTKSMFDNATKYPYLTEGKQYNEKPTFTDPKDLFTAQLVALKKFSVATVDTGSTAVLPDWRLVYKGAGNYVYYDWPIPVNLAYSNATLMAGATGKYPIGDLNWFPTQKTAWLAQRTAEYTAIQTALDQGKTTIATAVENASAVPVQFQLEQNYPNPFNPTTTISFSLPHAANATVKVMNMLGQEVATLVDGYMAAGSHQVTFDATKLASGSYFYKLTSGDFTQVKKMMLVK